MYKNVELPISYFTYKPGIYQFIIDKNWDYIIINDAILSLISDNTVKILAVREECKTKRCFWKTLKMFQIASNYIDEELGKYKKDMAVDYIINRLVELKLISESRRDEIKDSIKKFNESCNDKVRYSRLETIELISEAKREEAKLVIEDGKIVIPI